MIRMGGMMRKVTVALLAGAYVCVALTAALLLWRDGGGWGAAIAGGFGALGFTLGMHGLFQRAGSEAAIRGELAPIREAHLILADQMQALHEQVERLTVAVEHEAVQRSEELSGEVRMLEDLIQRMGESLESRLTAAARPAPAATAAQPNLNRQHSALLETVREALADNRVDLYLQPVVSLPQRRTLYYEGFSRLRDDGGRVIMPAEYLTVAEPGGLISAIDNLLLFRCVQIVRRLAKNDRKVGIFCNIALGSLADEAFFPQFLAFMSENRDLAGSLIFELGQTAFDRRGSVEARNMGKLADLGFRFSLDKITDLDLDFQDLARADVKFLKVGAELLLDTLMRGDNPPAVQALRDLDVTDFAELTRRYGVEVIAEKVEAERQVIDILELNVAFGQGNLFGEPRAIKDAILAEADPPADFIRSTLRRRAAR
jgi:cyclic-di-GMP phosphodiesterase, flagellum assembly factor TipF